ncbi:MAG: hypothetical protein CME62_17640 [Halobacteriovoraceae bacterium]|nr:hypothetical protein [Halobacteriovoraceae bacterium]
MKKNENEVIEASVKLFDYLELSRRELYQEVKTYLKENYSFNQVAFVNLKGSKLTNDENLDLSHLEETLHSQSQFEIGKLVQISDHEQVVVIYRSENSSQYFYTKSSDHQNETLNSIFISFIKSYAKLRAEKEKVSGLEILALTDDVTGLFNQRKLTEDLKTAVDIHQKEHKTFSIMFIDVDHFKNVNDNYGHIIGSQLLKDMGVLLKNILRETDHIYRYGGDEFVIIMPNISIEIVHRVASRVLKQLKAHEFKIDNGEIYNMSISIGIAEYPTDANTAKEIIRFADEMMYKSKKSGRGRVFHVNEVAHVDVDSK